MSNNEEIKHSVNMPHAFRMNNLNSLSKFMPIFPTRSYTTTNVRELKALLIKQLDTLPKIADITSDDSPVSTTYTVAGRIMMSRHMGGLLFLSISFDGETLQAVCKKNYMYFIDDAEKGYSLFVKHIDLGDWVELTGYICKTNKNEPSLFVTNARLMCKTLTSLPEKHKGLQDTELRYRKRWLDLISNDHSLSLFKQRSFIIKTIREFMWAEGFIEVDTPIISNVYGGANASPFTTYVNALEEQNFLRISLEIPLKKLLVGGMHAVFEIGKVFRNESIDSTHLPEFTSMEVYKTFTDYRYIQNLTSQLYSTICQKLYGSNILKTTYNDAALDLDLSHPWKSLSVFDSVEQITGIDFKPLTVEQIRQFVLDLQLAHIDRTQIPTMSKGSLIMVVFENLVESTLIGPIHIIDYPVESTPLCKALDTQLIPGVTLVERVESYIMGTEISNGYTELNDPILQRQLLEAQITDEDSHPVDEEFLDCLLSGLPTASGIGFGIDRLITIFLKCASIKDVVLFPMMKSIYKHKIKEISQQS